MIMLAASLFESGAALRRQFEELIQSKQVRRLGSGRQDYFPRGSEVSPRRSYTSDLLAWGSRCHQRLAQRIAWGLPISQQKRTLIAQVFGWMKTVGGPRKLRHRGGARVDRIGTVRAADT
jgi:hypothetical protein